ETLKIDHRWSSTWTLTGVYGHQQTREPGSAFWGPHAETAGDPGGGTGYRDTHFIGLNNIFIPNNTTAVAVRYGYNSFRDAGTRYMEFDAATLGFPSNYISDMPFNTFPALTLAGYGTGTGTTVGNNGPSTTTHVGQTANMNVSKFMGRHSMKFGADYRRIEARSLVYGSSAGAYTFNQGFTQGPTPTTASAASGDAIASLLLGYPASGELNVATPGNFFFDYYSAYAQDDFRVGSDLTLTVGMRYEYEAGMAEKANGITVGFDRSAAFPIQVPGLDLKGGLQYAGVDGNPTNQAKPVNGFAPRGGFAWSLDEDTVIRGGYGFFWAPTIMPGVGEAVVGSRGYSAATTYLASTDGNLTPAGSLSNPFPNGVTPPLGNSQGLLTGAGGVVDFVDQDSQPGYVQQYSLDFQRTIFGGSVIGFGYMGSRSERLSMGGTSDATVNINQLDPQYLALGTALQQLVPNPFFGIAEFGNLSRSATISRGQLLRPFPQFDNVLMHRVNQASARYNAFVTRWSKRMSDGYALDVNYTFSRLEDNQFGESNTFSNRQGSALDNYDLGREFGVSLLDVAHRLNVNATFELPFGEGHKWASSGAADAAFGGWTVTVAGRYQTGFPISVWQSSNNSGLLGSNQRPNVVPGVEVMTTGSQEERAVSGWVNPAAFTSAPAFTLGNAPRTNPDWRGPGQRTTDLAISKTQRLASTTLTFRADVLNLFDDPLFNGPITTFGTANFGQIATVGGFARSMQFQVRLGW
ncbi:MAG TPA: TonB-dependent receptor, partial [Vicinamibacterales bacterium]